MFLLITIEINSFRKMRQDPFMSLPDCLHIYFIAIKKVSGSGEYDYSGMGYLAPFTGAHPQSMKERIAAMDWEFTYDPARGKHSLKEDLLHRIEKITGWRPGEYKNYRL